MKLDTSRLSAMFMALLAGAILVLPAWGPSLRDPATGMRLDSGQTALLSLDRAPVTIGPVANLVDGPTQATLYARGALHHHAIGSITKLMTALLTVQRLKLNQVVTVSAKAASTPGSTMGLVAGDRLTVRALLYGLLIPSGNDAAEELAETMAGNDKGFARLANRQATKYGLTCSHFVTPHGLDAPHQYSCAADVGRLMRIVLTSRLLKQIMQTPAITVHGEGPGQVFPLLTTDDLLESYPGIIAGKTGTTDEAGASLTSADRRGRRILICVILGSTYLGRFSDCASMFTWGFADYLWPGRADTMWSIASLESPVTVQPSPIERWEIPWLTVGARGDVTVPHDSHD